MWMDKDASPYISYVTFFNNTVQLIRTLLEHALRV
jgi:hypothetical protein